MGTAMGAHLHVCLGVGHLFPKNGLLGLSHFHVISCDFHPVFHYNDRFGVSWSKNMILMLFSTTSSHLVHLAPRFEALLSLF